jgi:hypothetical protein
MIIEPWHVGIIILEFVNIYESPIDESNITLEFRDVCIEGNMFLSSKSLDLITFGFINARCDEKCIITYCTLVP